MSITQWTDRQCKLQIGRDNGEVYGYIQVEYKHGYYRNKNMGSVNLETDFLVSTTNKYMCGKNTVDKLAFGYYKYE